ncbi:MAG TPA: hypothetical protein VLV83_13075 [Acidobacteriota bacterium]|nr:hypothetical protein [Acidobacteriota bacterium]
MQMSRILLAVLSTDINLPFEVTGMPKRLLLFLFCALVSPHVLAQQVSVREGTSRFSWPGPNEITSANGLDKEEVRELVQSLQADQFIKVQVGEFRFVALEPGEVWLVATTDYSGRNFFFSLSLVKPTDQAGSFRYAAVSSHGPHVLGREIVDLDGDGSLEILTKEPATDYQGAETVPLYWIAVAKLTGGELQDRSADFPKFYLGEYLPSLNLLEGAAQDETEAAIEHAAAVAFLRFRMEREVFDKPLAGLAEALSWATASSRQLQILAVRTLEDIEDPGADRGLERLTSSKDQLVARRAQTAREAKRQRQ